MCGPELILLDEPFVGIDPPTVNDIKGIISDLREDLYAVLAGVVGGTEQAVFRFTINPLVWWVWYGGMIVALGGVIVMWPGGAPAVRRTQGGYAVKLVGEGK